MSPAAGAALLLALSLVAVEDPSSTDAAARRERLRREVVEVEAAAARLAGREQSLLSEIAVLGTRRDLASAEAAAAEAELADGRRELAAAEFRAREADRLEQAALTALGARLRALERSGPASTLRAALLAPDPETVVAGMREVSGLARRDARLAKRARGLAAQVAEMRRELATRQTAAAAAAERATATAASAAEAGQKLEARLLDVRGKRDLYAKAGAELVRAAAELDAFLAGRVATVPAGPDVRALRGTLAWPLPGAVQVPFGPRRHARFGTVLPHNGLTLQGTPGEPVLAVAAGTVVWAEWFEGFGRTVILDHGSGVMTVAAHLGGLSVAAGQVVSAGEPVGEVGDSSALEGPGLYFEIRVDGLPVDPRIWLAPRGLPEP